MSRVILLDANVIEQIGRGNQAAANALRQLRASGATIYVSHQAYTEMVDNPAIPRTAAAKREFLREMGIQIAPHGNPALQQQVIAANTTGKGTILSGADVRTAAQARAINAEVWSFDRGFRNNTNAVRTKLGVSVAEETLLPLAPQGSPEDYRVARRLTGLPEIEIDLNGNVKRGSGGGGGGAGAGGGAGGSSSSPVSRVRPRIRAAKAAFRSGIAGAFSAANIASMIPEVILHFADRAAAVDAMKNIQIKFIKAGFARGVAAGLMGLTENEVESSLLNQVTAFRIHGMGDAAGLLKRQHIFQLAENSENYAVVIGYYYSSGKPNDWKKDLRAKGFDRLAKMGYRFEERDLFDFPFIDKLAFAIQPMTDSIIGPAIRFK